MRSINRTVVAKQQSIICVKQSCFFCCLMNFRSILRRDARPGPFSESDDFDPNISSTGQNYEINKITLYYYSYLTQFCIVCDPILQMFKILQYR